MPFLDVAVLPLRGVQAIFSIIVLGLTAYIIDVTSTYWWHSWSSIDFMLFCSVWTILAVAYLVLAPSRFPAAAHKFAIFGVEAITMIFWFAGWIAVASLWGDLRCGSLPGSCGAGTAAIVFSAVIWLAFVATSLVAGLHVRNTSSRNTSAPPQMQGV
ncbi:hypothetical protein P280DRAFT_465161 [Massarina eburnea CBS 473.64]|uniref:MARVEL domain-containing protein n=1 Tax=Massarina eburnea CBS 473.64 TaxID=1395130 RepID=A0A6A6SEM2_9PLEO|nr:hypothetical protein P280DRAFT_465161 [Massarina eburnea CBS 473.64]